MAISSVSGVARQRIEERADCAAQDRRRLMVFVWALYASCKRSSSNGSPNKALQPTAAAVLVCQGQKLHLAAAAAELGR
jgi:hypothetical protein